LVPRSCNGWPSSISTFRTCDSTAIAIDVGDQDNLKVDTGKLHDVLTNYGIKHDRDRLRYTHEQCRGSLPRKRDAIFQPNAVIRNGEALTRASDLTSRHSTEGA
jgi:hypothetical protein